MFNANRVTGDVRVFSDTHVQSTPATLDVNSDTGEITIRIPSASMASLWIRRLNDNKVEAISVNLKLKES